MSNVNSVNGPPPVGPGDIDVPNVGQLSPEALLEFCSMQIRSMDGSIKAQMDKQQDSLKFNEAITNLRKLYSQGEQGCNDKQRAQQILDAYREAYKYCPPEDRAALNQAFNDYRSTACWNDGGAGYQPKDLGSYTDQDEIADYSHPDVDDHNKVTGDEFTQLDKPLATLADSVSKNAEMEMISLQSKISTRQTIVQMTSNMLSKVNETVQSVVGNIKQ